MTYDVCIAGGGPAGMMLGLLLARAGIHVLVLEKHSDFLRDFRGDTVHPSTLEILYELGLLEQFLKRPHQKVHNVSIAIGGEQITMGDFARVPTRCKFIAFMPQWEFLDFVKTAAQTYSTFHLMMDAEVRDLLREGDRVTGALVRTEQGDVKVHAKLVVGADGRNSIVREKAGLQVEDLGAPIDVLWMRISRLASDTDQVVGRIDRGRVFVMLNRGDYWQCAFVIAKGSVDEVRARGISSFQDEILALAPFLGERARELADFEMVKLLTVKVDRLKEWALPGLLCIGDAAHAMSPVGGVGINLAIQDAVATANLLTQPLRENRLSFEDLKLVQKRRAWPTSVIQSGQLLAHSRVIWPVLKSTAPLKVPGVMRLFAKIPALRTLPALVIGVGVRPEHVRS